MNSEHNPRSPAAESPPIYSISWGGKTIQYGIKRGKRKKSVAICVGREAKVTVWAPRYLDEEKIQGIVGKKARWIIEKQESIRAAQSLNPPKEFVSGETFLYLGRRYRLEVRKSARKENCKLIHGRLRAEIGSGSEEKEVKGRVRRVLLVWYFERAAERIRERMDLLAPRVGKWPQSMEIKDHKARWGSCSPSGVVRFNWRIIMAPLPVVDYVIVHELCHLLHHHHSHRFWQKVESILPDYQKRQAVLRKSNLTFEEAR